MSGPKYNNASLMEQQRKRLEEERRRRIEEERRKAEEEKRRQEELKCQELERKISAARKTVQDLKTVMRTEITTRIEEARNLFTDSCGIQNTCKLLEALFQKIDAFPGSYTSRNSGVMFSYLQSLSALMDEVVNQKNGVIQDAVDDLNKEIKEYKISTGEKAFLSKTIAVKRKKGVSLNIERKTQQEALNSDMDKELAAFYESVSPYQANIFLVNKGEIQDLVMSVEQIRKSKHLDLNYKAAQIQVRRKTFLATKSKYDREIEQYQRMCSEFDKQLSRYLAVCRIIGNKSKPFTFEPQNALRIISDLREEIKQQESSLARKEETEYIANTINKVMEELGYDIIATDFMTTPKRNVIHNIYDFENGNAINVFTSDNGSLLFEVSGIKEGTGDLTALEKLKIKESMEVFCTKYPVIKESLKSKGIQLTCEDLKPADERYAHAIDLSKKKRILKGQKKESKIQPQIKKKGVLRDAMST